LRLLAERLDFSNPWVAAVDGARRRPAAIAALAAVLAVGALAVLGGAALAARLTQAMRVGDSLLARTAIAYACIFLPLWSFALIAAAREGRAMWRGEGRGANLTLGFAAGAIGYGAAVAVAAAAGVVVIGAEGGGAAALAGAAASLVLVAFQAGAEETVFRGWLQPILCARWGVWVGLLVGSAAFAALHLVSGVRGPVALINLLLGGLMFGLLALRSGGLWAPFTAHLGWNWTEASLLGLEPNPGVGPGGSIVDLDLAGRPLWSGAAEGMNGSLAMTLVLLAGILLLTGVGRLRA
jgi:uncharacterized protein